MIDVRYQERGDNRLLRHFLRLEWDQQCYWCNNFKDYGDLEIDHILPRALGVDELAKVKRTLDLFNEYDINALYNLAPICGPCNKEKANHDLTGKPVVLMKIKKARKLAPSVAKQVASFREPSNIAGALLEAAEADLSNTHTREIFEKGAPAVVQRLAELGEGKVDFFVRSSAEVEVGDDLHLIKLKLNERARAAVDVLTSVAGGRLGEVLSAPLPDLFTRIASIAKDEFEKRESRGSPDAEPLSIESSEITIDRIEFNSSPPAHLEFEFAALFEAFGRTIIARDSPQDGELEYVQGEASVDGRFMFTFSWTPKDPVGQFQFDDVHLGKTQADLWIDGESYSEWDDLIHLYPLNVDD